MWMVAAEVEIRRRELIEHVFLDLPLICPMLLVSLELHLSLLKRLLYRLFHDDERKALMGVPVNIGLAVLEAKESSALDLVHGCPSRVVVASSAVEVCAIFVIS